MASTTSNGSYSGVDLDDEKSFDPALFDVTRIPVNDFANQITLDDFEIFKRITPEELNSIGWNGSNKMSICPGIVELTQRFNRVSFWVISVILQKQTNKIRSEVVQQFIKIAKRLHDLSNFHGMLAIVSALSHPSVHRLTETWSRINAKDRKTFENLQKFAPEEEGRQLLQSIFQQIKLPCIPHLGLILLELVYIDTKHPRSDGLEDESRQLKMNNILRLISEYQQSDYSHLPRAIYIQKYLKSFDYISELQRFLEDQNYKQSFTLQPRNGASCDDLAAKSMSDRFRRGHRRCVSLGRSPRRSPQLNVSLLDDQPIAIQPMKSLNYNSLSSNASSSLNSNGTDNSRIIPEDINPASILFEGCLLRKKTAKRGQKMALPYGIHYWCILTSPSDGDYHDSVLYLYEAKHRPIALFFKSYGRASYKYEVTKQIVLSHYVFSDICPKPDDFSLTHVSTGDCYRFRAVNSESAVRWREAVREAMRPKSKDLMKFE